MRGMDEVLLEILRRVWRARARAPGRPRESASFGGVLDLGDLASRSKLDALRTAIDGGDASGVAEDSSLALILGDVRARRAPPKSQP